ncbi:MAG TPA: hypothetical protein VMD30_07465 [Tepidisphaeraceae bacterium]|nr:hypothetical protein [Tepidisphaeraceae bacterium]
MPRQIVPGGTAVTFKQAVEQTPNFASAWHVGLRALRKRDRIHVRTDEPARLTGSVDIDTTLKRHDPRGSRWDFAIGYQHSNRSDEFIYWVEVHTGNDAELKVVLRKLEWLKNWLDADGSRLSRFKREFVWIASGATSFTRGAPQRKVLAAKGLNYRGSSLHISTLRADP